jgi:hypothetical protein
MLPFLAVTFVSALCTTLGNASATIDCRIDGNRVTVTLEAESFNVFEEPHGQRLKMDDFGHLTTPGRPHLPMKKFLIALPPGTRAESIEILRTRTSQLPGTYRIVPSSPIVPLPDMQRWDDAMKRMQGEWQAEYDALYLSDLPFPSEAAWLAGRGALRKYSYAAVAFCPFTYYPESGRLEHHSEIEIVIDCEMVHSDGPDTPLSRLLMDQAADERASGLFSNYAQVADLYNPEGAGSAPQDEIYDYVIITIQPLVNAITASEFLACKSAFGHSVKTVLTTDSEITSQPGQDLSEQIRNFLRTYYATWSIEYVLIVGDYATVPMRICYPDPAFHVYDPSDPGLVAPGTPTDYYYADLSYSDAISWDLDGDGYHGEYSEDAPDFLAEVAVGRIPVNNPTRITYALNKMVAFEEDNGAWKNNVLHAGAILFFENQDYSGYPFIDGATCLDSIETGLMSGYNISHLSEQQGIVTSHFDWPPLSEATFTGNWRNLEHAIVNWSGHGWPDGAYRTIWAWDDGDGVPEHGNGEMQSSRFIGHGSPVDDDHPSIVFAISCDVGWPEPNPYGNLGIDLLTLQSWGPSAGIVSSARPAAISGDWKNDPGGTEQICFDFNRYMIVEREPVGDALYDGKFHATTHYGWDRVYEYMNLYNFNLYGDPSLEIDRSTVSVTDAGGRSRELVHLLPSSPNPFESVAALRFNMSVTGPLRVTVHDVAGRLIATLADGNHDAGRYVLRWDGTNERGKRLPPGLYFAIAKTAGYQASQKLILLK